MNTPSIAILVLGYNHKNTLQSALQSALQQSYTNYQLVYIDNASIDGSAEFVAEVFPGITLVRNEENLGYAGGYDAALKVAFAEGHEAAVLLNPDTVADTDWLAELVSAAYAEPDIALAQSKVLIWRDGPSEVINSFGNKVNFLGFGYCGEYLETDGEAYSRDRDVPYASGSSLLIKKAYYPSRISFDCDYFAYLEDQDLGWQARVHGLRSIVAARSRIWHKYDFQKKNLNNFKFYLLERNRLFFLLKFYSGRLLLLTLPALLVMEAGVYFDALSKGYALRKLQAQRDFLLALPVLLRKRRALMASRTVSDKALLPFLSPAIDFSEVDSWPMRQANRFLRVYFSVIKRLI